MVARCKSPRPYYYFRKVSPLRKSYWHLLSGVTQIDRVRGRRGWHIDVQPDRGSRTVTVEQSTECGVGAVDVNVNVNVI